MRSNLAAAFCAATFIGALSCSPACPTQAATSLVHHFFADGYVCIRSRATLLVDSASPPSCATAMGITIPAIPEAALIHRTSQQQGNWRVTHSPVHIVGTFSEVRASIMSVRTGDSRSSRRARSFATVELAAFDVDLAPKDANEASTDTNTNPEAVFVVLPRFATTSGTATVRLARIPQQRGFRYGVFVRDANLTSTQRSVFEHLAMELGVPIAINMSAARRLRATDCSGIPLQVEQPSAPPVKTVQSRVDWIRTRWNPTAVSGCDELSQVEFVQSPIVGNVSGVIDQDRDLVVDATIRIVD